MSGRPSRPARGMLDVGYVDYINQLRRHRGLPVLTADEVWLNWEGFDVSGLLPVRSTA